MNIINLIYIETLFLHFCLFAFAMGEEKKLGEINKYNLLEPSYIKFPEYEQFLRRSLIVGAEPLAYMIVIPSGRSEYALSVSVEEGITRRYFLTVKRSNQLIFNEKLNVYSNLLIKPEIYKVALDKDVALRIRSEWISTITKAKFEKFSETSLGGEEYKFGAYVKGKGILEATTKTSTRLLMKNDLEDLTNLNQVIAAIGERLIKYTELDKDTFKDLEGNIVLMIKYLHDLNNGVVAVGVNDVFE